MGMVRQWQELLHGGRYSHSYSEALPDFVKLAEAYRRDGIRVAKPADLDAVDHRDDRDAEAGDRRLPSSTRLAELLPDDPIRQGA